MLASRKKWKALYSTWIAALARDETRIPCETEQAAKRLQNNLYAAKRRAANPRHLQQEVLDAGSELSITRERATLIIYKRYISSEILAATGAATTTSEEGVATITTPDESFSRLEQLLRGGSNDE